MKKLVMNAALAALLSTASTAAIAGERVAIGVPSWTGAQAIAHLIATVVTERIGGEVEMVPSNNATIFRRWIRAKVTLTCILTCGFQTRILHQQVCGGRRYGFTE